MSAQTDGRLRALIVDDEKLARDRLRRFLRSDPQIEIIGECDGGQSAIATILTELPDIVFLDIQMPETTGFDVITALKAGGLSSRRMPAIVFVTAYDQYAVEAFEVHALDYIVKPFDAARVRDALEHVKEHAARTGDLYSARIAALIDQLDARSSRLEDESAKRWQERIAVKSRDRIVFVNAASIDWIESAGNYLRLHTGDKSHLIRESLSALTTRLDPSMFVRIHRRVIVNIERVREMQPWFAGDWIVILRSGTQLRMSRNYRELIERARGTTSGTV